MVPAATGPLRAIVSGEIDRTAAEGRRGGRVDAP